MPLYRCLAPAGAINLEQRPTIAKAFTDIHCESTGAPRDFVHVLFFDQPDPGDAPGRSRYFIDGGNRAGRSPEVRQQLLDDLKKAFCDIAQVPPGEVGGRITETPASWIMEGGEIMPEPGQEGPEWFSGQAAAS